MVAPPPPAVAAPPLSMPPAAAYAMSYNSSCASLVIRSPLKIKKIGDDSLVLFALADEEEDGDHATHLVVAHRSLRRQAAKQARPHRAASGCADLTKVVVLADDRCHGSFGNAPRSRRRSTALRILQ